MTSKHKNTLLVVLGFVIVFLVWRLHNGQVRLNSFKNQLNKFSIEKQYFNEIVNENNITIASQEQVILSQQDAIRYGLLEIENLKKIKSQVRTVSVTKIDSIFIELHDTLTLKDTIYPKGFLEVPKRFDYKEKYFDLQGLVTLDKLIVDSLKLHNEMKLTIGNKRNGWFKKSTPIVELENTNPYMTTLDMNNVIIQKDKRIIDKKAFWVGIGVVGTYLILK